MSEYVVNYLMVAIHAQNAAVGAIVNPEMINAVSNGLLEPAALWRQAQRLCPDTPKKSRIKAIGRINILDEEWIDVRYRHRV